MRNNEIALISLILLAIGVLSLTFGIVVPANQATSEIPITTNLNSSFKPSVECRVVESHTIQYVDRPVTEVKYIECVKSVPVELRNFNDLKELEQWVGGMEKITVIRFESLDATIDCDDYALWMQQKALADGYIMSFQVIAWSEYNTIFRTKLPTGSLHAINLAIVGNNAYFIEPQTGEVVFAAYLD